MAELASRRITSRALWTMTTTGATGSWTPILWGREAAHAREVVKDIAEFAKAVDATNATLSRGAAGIATFLSYYSVSFSDASAADRAVELLDRAIDIVAEMPMRASLFGGFTGIAWTMHHLADVIGSCSEDDPLASVDEAVGTLLACEDWRGPYDLITGLAGLGVYSLERLPLPGARSCLQQIVRHLAQLSRPMGPGMAWYTPPELLPSWRRSAAPAGLIDLGVAHGNPAVLAILAKIVRAGVSTDDARTLFESGVEWLLANAIAGHPGGRFAASVSNVGETYQPARLGWCYGDLGLAAALLTGARAIGCSRSEEAALETALGAATRVDRYAGVVDAGLCHGAFGNAHIFNRMYQATGDLRLRRAARHWIERGLALRRQREGAAGFYAYGPDQLGSGGWHADPGFLTGVAGIGLAMLAACTDVTPDWDRSLLIDVAAS